MAKDLKKAAQDALDFNPHLDKVYVTSDGTPFVNKNDAVNHARSFDDKNVAVFERDGDDLEDDDTAGDATGDKVDKPMAAKDLIILIEGAESIEAVDNLANGDKRATVKAAASKRIAELKQNAIDAQAAAADEALKQRSGETGAQGGAGDPGVEMIEVVVTQETLDLNPELVDQGVKVGETVKVPKEA